MQKRDDLPSSVNLATRRRRDIQGLRAVAVLLVALDHAGVGFLKGGYVGVDVFFVLSGYLITGVLVKLVESTGGRAYFSTFYARRARRILPAATLTLLITDIAASHLLNLERAHQVLVDSVYSTFFVANIHFANVGTDYFAMGQPPSALQNFWSLSVEEQFYLVWPLLMVVALLGIVFLTRSRRQHQTDQAPSQGALRRVGILAVGITAASFAYAVYDTHHSSTAAYFSSPARAWELGLGAVLALNARRVARLPQPLLLLCGWLGIAAILIASIEYSPSTLFPGLPALLPTVGAAAVIAAGLRADQAPRAVSRILSLAPFRYVGDRSYTFYLWHWPVLILAAEYADHSLSLATNLLLLAGAFVLSTVTYALFENPLRRTPKLQGSTALALWPVTIAIVLFASSIYWSDYQDAVNLAYSPPQTEVLKETSEVALTASTEPAQSGWRPSSPAAVVTAAAAIGKSGPIPSPLTPAALALPSSEYKVPEKCVAFPGETRSQICNLGDTSSKKSLVVFGDSHAVMWMPAILSFAKHNGYDVRPIMKYSCTEATWASGQCGAWYAWGVAQIRAFHPSLVILAAHYNITPKEGEISWKGPNAISNTSGFGDAVAHSVRHVVVLGDPPGQAQEPTDCLLSSHPTMKTCSYTETSGQSETTAGMESATKAFGVFLDTTPWFCYRGKCPMVVGHTIVNFNTNHITTEYAEELAPLFTTALTRLLAPVAVTKTPHPTGVRPRTGSRASNQT